MSRFIEAEKIYAKFGVDCEAALDRLSSIPVSIHCWQGDDLGGFEGSGTSLSGGLQVTGNYPGKARTPQELMADFDMALSLIPGEKRLSLHASYAIFKPGAAVDRDRLEPGHFTDWVEYARPRGLGLDFNPTFFSHPKAASGLTLSHPDPDIRRFWIEHGKACRRIAAWFAAELGTHCLCNIWIPDGYKDIPADRLAPRLRLKDSLDEIFAEKLPGVVDSVESKVFGIGVESYTVGSAEFYLGYAAKRGDLYPLLDNGHFHPNEMTSDKIPSLLAFFDKLPLHVTRSVRWDSDHVVLFEDELREIAKEIIRNRADERVLIGLDYFDASINRVAAWVVGARNMNKALLYALLTPSDYLKELQDRGGTTELMAITEDLKTAPFGDVWTEYCRRQRVPADTEWFGKIKEYESEVLSLRD